MKTNAHHYKIFKQEAQRWLSFFGLTGWKVYFEHSDVKGADYRAMCSANLSGRISTITLCKEWGINEVTDAQVKMSAFHEVCELLLVRIEILANSRDTRKEEVEEERHNLIRIFENTIYKRISPLR